MNSNPNRDYILLFVNGVEHHIRGNDAFLPLSDFLRYQLNICGTKVVCAEGDCGACTVMIGRMLQTENKLIGYKALNGCIQFLFQLDCTHVITVEGVADDGVLNPVQKAMVDCHGAQCGCCTPGFVVALSGLLDECQRNNHSVCKADVKEALTGNLCRCTGYESIIRAALKASESKITPFAEKYSSDAIIESLQKHRQQSVLISGNLLEKPALFFKPSNLNDAIRFKSEHAGTTIISGGTDVCVNINKRQFRPEFILSLTGIESVDTLAIEEIEKQPGAKSEQMVVGAQVSLRDLEKFCQEKIPEFYKILWVFGSPQIRQAGILAGNIANGSPIADSLPFLYVMEAKIELTGVAGTRCIPVSSLYQGYKKMDIGSDEIITRILIPMPRSYSDSQFKTVAKTPNDLLKLFKVSKREHLDIASVCAAFRLQTEPVEQAENGSRRISLAKIAIGGVAATCVNLEKTQAFLNGKNFSLNTFERAGQLAATEVTPISDVRGCKSYRSQLVVNLFLKFFYETADPSELEMEALCQT